MHGLIYDSDWSMVYRCNIFSIYYQNENDLKPITLLCYFIRLYRKLRRLLKQQMHSANMTKMPLNIFMTTEHSFCRLKA